MAARIATVNTDTQERALVADADRTVKSVEQRNPSAVQYATFAELQEHQENLPKVALLGRMNLDPGDNPVSGLGLLSDARLNLKQARETIAHCRH